jgi:dihydroorotate dehydrogenase (NAD+) catalytic subunit
MNISVHINGLVLKNPLTVASGTAGYGEELARYLDLARLGAIFTKGLSLRPRPGNSGNRILETPSGVLNSIGLENVGLERFLSEKLPFLAEKGATVIPNVAGHSVEENADLCRELSADRRVAALELNVSCPNVKEGGMVFGTDLDRFTEVVEKSRKASRCPLIVKLSPNVTDIAAFAKRAEELGADAVSAVNTYLGMKIDVKKRRPHFENRVAGLSGPAIRPLAVRAVYQVYEKVRIPVIGLGGIATLEDMLEFIMAGASAVSIGTMNMVDPDVSVGLIGELERWLAGEQISDLKEIVGIAHPVRDGETGCST